MNNYQISKQQAFSAVYQGMKAQGYERVLDVQGHPTHRRDFDLCPIGILLRLFKQPTINTTPDELVALTGLDVEFLTDLVMAHDLGFTPDELRGGLNFFAEKYALVVPA